MVKGTTTLNFYSCCYSTKLQNSTPFSNEKFSTYIPNSWLENTYLTLEFAKSYTVAAQLILYFDHLGTHSIVLLGCCDARCLFTMVDIGSAGHNSDGGVFSHSKFGQSLEQNKVALHSADVLRNTTGMKCPFLFVADDAFPLKTWTMKPHKGSFLSESQRVFNYRLSRARRIIENTFGIASARWRVWRQPILASPEKVTSIAKAVCVLHNYLMIEESGHPHEARNYCPTGFTDSEDRYLQYILFQQKC